jgi:hypothetical protein
MTEQTQDTVGGILNTPNGPIDPFGNKVSEVTVDPRTENLSQAPYGWICPNCKRIYSPNTSECSPCNQQRFKASAV